MGVVSCDHAKLYRASMTRPDSRIKNPILHPRPQAIKWRSASSGNASCPSVHRTAVGAAQARRKRNLRTHILISISEATELMHIPTDCIQTAALI